MAGLNRALIAGCVVLSQILNAMAWAEDKPEPPNVVTFEPVIRADQMRPHIEFLAGPTMEGRASAAKEKARDYIIARLKAAKLQPLFNESPIGELPDPTNGKPPTTPSFVQTVPGAQTAVRL